MTYRTVFDVANQGSTPWWPSGLGLVFIAVGTIIILKPQAMRRFGFKGVQRVGRTATRQILGFAALWTAGSFIVAFNDYRAGMTTLESGRVAVVAGIVRDFVPAPTGGHRPESFTVQGTSFSYSDAILTGGFHTSASHGGPMREGLEVRITYSGNVILRLEVAE